MHYNKAVRNAFAALIIVSAILGTAVVVAAQNEANTPVTKRSASENRDPFKRYEPPRVVPKRLGQLLPPSIEERIAQYRAQKMAAMRARMSAPKPTTALLLSEMQVIGITRTPRGYAAIVEATPIKLSYVIYPGERFYDGQLVAIEDERLIFRHETVFNDGRRERTVETKTLRQPNTADSISAVRTAPADTSAGASDKEKPAMTDKP